MKYVMIFSSIFISTHGLAAPSFSEAFRKQNPFIMTYVDQLCAYLIKQDIKEANAEKFIARYNAFSQKNTVHAELLAYAQAVKKNIEHEQLMYGTEELNGIKLVKTVTWAGIGATSLITGIIAGTMGFVSVEGNPLLDPILAKCIPAVCGYIAYLGLWSARKDFYISRHQKTHVENQLKNIDTIIAHLETFESTIKQ